MSKAGEIATKSGISSQPLAGRRILITGGGSGLAVEMAGEAVRLGARVALLDRDGAAARRTAEALGPQALAVEGDVTDEAAGRRALDAMEAAWGGIDDLVNNAGTWHHGDLLDLEPEHWRRVLDVNLMAPITLSNAAVRRMGGGGSIVNVSSVLGQVIAPGRGPYCISKAALISLTKLQAVEWASRGIRVNAIAPGYIANETTLALADTGSYTREAICKRTPLGRFGTAAEVAAGVCFLLDPARAAYISGHVLEVNGGWTAYGFI